MKRTKTTGWEIETAFERVYGIIDDVPIFGLQLSKMLPMFVLLFVFLNATNCYSRLMKFVGLGNLTFGSGDLDIQKYQDGKSLVNKYRNKLEKKMPSHRSSYQELKKVFNSMQGIQETYN